MGGLDSIPREGVRGCRRKVSARHNKRKGGRRAGERDLARKSRQRLLPDEKTLEKVARYEAHLSRLFHKALRELEALQTRRSGGVASLARLEVDGLAGG
jgi:hypothetical protein